MGNRIKVIAPKSPDFIIKAHEYHGDWKEPAWYFDDMYQELVKVVLRKLWGVDGEESYEECTLYIRNYSATVEQGPIYLFNRLIAQSYGHGQRSVLGEDINFIFGRYKVGGISRDWTTVLEDATFEINRFPLPATKFPAVQQAIADKMCVVKRDDGVRTRELIEVDIEIHKLIINKLERELLIHDGLKTKS